MYVRPPPSRPSRHKPRPRSRPRLLLPASSPPFASPPSSPLPLPPSSPQVRVKWEPGLVRLEDLVQEYPLPQLVQCHTRDLQPRDGGHLAVPLDRPILLAEQRTVRHLLARVVHYDHRSGTFNESTDSVVIPEDYEGNFLRLQSRTTKDKTKVKSLEAIAHDDTPAFLNLANITSFPVHRHDPDDMSRFIYTAGNVFLVDEPLPPEPKDTKSEEGGNDEQSHSVVSDSSRHKSATSSSSGRNSNGVMKCLDERGMPIKVPTNQVGEMVTVQGGGEGQARLSVKSRDMMINQQFPLLTRYAYGKKQPRLTAFTKLLTLLDSFQETSIIACILNTSSLMLLELPLTSSLSFRVAANLHDELLKVPRLRKAVEVCHTQGRELARDIKFKYKLSHRVQEDSRRMVRKREEDELLSATVRSRLVVTETYVYI